jgi:multiple sugar transport system substrate-binding protein
VFPHVVEQEFTRGNAVYALPVTLDTLALLYNKSIFDAQGIALPPGNWLAFQDLAQSLGKGSAAIGGSGRTIERAADIISVLMLQDRVPMADEQGNVVLQGAQGALAFYAKFGSAKGKYGVWDNASPSAFTRFAAGTLPMAFGYYADLRALRAANPQLRAGAAPLPQPASGSVNYARYHGLAVWSQSKNPEAAWRFIATVTMDPRFAAMYSGAANTPPALRELIAQVANDPELGAFALQALSARAWPRPDDRIVDAAFTQMIESIHKGGAPLKDALDAAERAINSFAYPFQ